MESNQATDSEINSLTNTWIIFLSVCHCDTTEYHSTQGFPFSSLVFKCMCHFILHIQNNRPQEQNHWQVKETSIVDHVITMLCSF